MPRIARDRSPLWSEGREQEARRAPPRQNLQFSPRWLDLWVLALMQDYQGATGKGTSSHDSCKVAFTCAAVADTVRRIRTRECVGHSEAVFVHFRTPVFPTCYDNIEA